MSVEVEIKLKMQDSDTGSAILEDPLVASMTDGDVRVIEMESVYYDTPGRDLGARRWGLRLRSENGVSVAALKADEEICGAISRRGEWQAAAKSVEEAVPELIAAGAPPELGTLASLGLIPCCRVEFTRKLLVLREGDASFELALDEGMLGDRRREPFFELELELLSGDMEAILALADALAARHGLVPEPKSKLERALALSE